MKTDIPRFTRTTSIYHKPIPSSGKYSAGTKNVVKSCVIDATFDPIYLAIKVHSKKMSNLRISSYQMRRAQMETRLAMGSHSSFPSTLMPERKVPSVLEFSFFQRSINSRSSLASLAGLSTYMSRRPWPTLWYRLMGSFEERSRRHTWTTHRFEEDYGTQRNWPELSLKGENEGQSRNTIALLFGFFYVDRINLFKTSKYNRRRFTMIPTK